MPVKREVLKYIRVKTAFHVDPETIKNFMEIEKDKKHNFGLFQISLEGEGYSPMISGILSYKFFERLLSDGEERLVTKEILDNFVKLQN